MGSFDQTFATLTKDSLYQFIAMNHAPVGHKAMQSVFGIEEETQSLLAELLSELNNEGHIVSDDDKGGFRAAKPWADIAYAIVGPINGKSRVPVRIKNLPDDLDPGVTISRNDVHKYRLEQDSQIIIGLGRGTTDLRARFIAHADPERPHSLTGIFNHKSGQFTPLDRTIKTAFRLAQEPVKNEVPRQFLVQLPTSFDVRNPVIDLVEDQAHDINSGESISEIVSKKHKIFKDHSPEVLAEAIRLSRKKINLKDRADLRHLYFVTVDPAGSKDLDDAFCATVESDGYAVYTAIADVPAIVPYGSLVDQEAYRRGLSFYLANDHTVHMLPAVLSEGKLSLLPKKDRFAIVVKQSLDWEGRLKSYEVMAAVVRSREQLSYGQFYDLLEQKDPRFKTIAAIHEMRRRQGLDKEFDAYLKESADRYSTKSIVETLMVQTNSLLAQFLENAGQPFLSRNLEQIPNKGGLIQRAYYATLHKGHSQLGLRHYAHATSPIRRDGDVVNLRAVHRVLGTPGIGISAEEISRLEEYARHLNARRDVDRNATHDIQKHHAIRDLARLQAAPVRISIHEIGHDYIEVTIIQSGLRQRIQSSELPANQWQIDGNHHELVLLDHNGMEARRYRRGEGLLGQLSDIDPSSANWSIRLLASDYRTPAAAVTSQAPKLG